MNYRHKLALITGGSSGIGLALAKELSARGAHVWIAARGEESLRAAFQQISSKRVESSQQFGYISLDVADAEAVKLALRKLEDQNGVPDLVINSAGVVQPGYFQELDTDVFRWMMDVNYFGSVYVTKAVIPGMIERGSGHHVFISSIVGVIGIFGYTAYSPSKYAVVGFADALRMEMKLHGIQVATVFPPDTGTPQLTYEKRYRPPELMSLIKTFDSKPVSSQKVAEEILKGIDAKKEVITPGFEAALLYRLVRIFGRSAFPILNWVIARANRKSTP